MREKFRAAMEALLRRKGYDLIGEQESESFGNYQKIYKRGVTEIKFGSDRDFAYADMRDANIGEWVDLSLLCQRANLGTEDVLTEPVLLDTIEKSLGLLEAAVAEFPLEEIERLRTERLKRRMPGIRP